MTVELAGLLAGLGCLGFGHGALVVFSGGADDAWNTRGRLEWLVTAALLGLVLLPAIVYAAIWLSGPLAPMAGNGLLGLGVLVGALSWKRLPAASREPSFKGLDRILCLVCAAFVLIALGLSSASPVHLFDPMFHFAYKGKVLFIEGLGGGGFTDIGGAVGRVMTHPGYPPLVPSLDVLASFPLGEFSASAGRSLFFLFVLAPAVWIYGALEGRSRRARLIGALLWLGLPMLYYYRMPHTGLWKSVAALIFGIDGAGGLLGGGGWHLPDGASLDGGGDLPLAALLCGAVVFLGRPKQAAGDGMVAGVLLGGAILAKNEGLALCAVLLVALGLRAGFTRAGQRMEMLADRKPLLALGAAICLALPWLIQRREIPVIDESYPELMQPVYLASALTTDRLYQGHMESAPITVGREYLSTFMDPLHWNLLWPLFLIAALCAVWRPRKALDRNAFLPMLITLGALTSFFLILIVTPWHLGKLFTTGIPDRLFLQVAPLAAWAVAAWVFEADNNQEPSA